MPPQNLRKVFNLKRLHFYHVPIILVKGKIKLISYWRMIPSYLKTIAKLLTQISPTKTLKMHFKLNLPLALVKFNQITAV